MDRQTDDWLEAYLEYTEATEPPTIFHKWVGVFCIAAAMKREIYCQVEYVSPWYPNFYIVLVAPSGKARKSTALSYGSDLIKEVDGINMSSEAVTRESLLLEMQESLEETMQGTEVEEHSSLSIISSELTSFLRFNNLQFLSDLTDWYDCQDVWRNRTKTQGTEEVRGVWLNLLGATTPHSIQSSVPEDMIGGGFTSRIIFVYSDEKKESKAPTWGQSDKDKKLRSDLVHDLRHIEALNGKFQFTEDAATKYTELYHKLDKDPPVKNRHFQGYNARRQVHMIKTAMVSSLSRNNRLLMKEYDIMRAHKLLKETERVMPRTFLGYGEREDSGIYSEVGVFIAQKQETTSGEIWRNFHKDIMDQEHLSEILKGLARAKIVELESNSETTIVRINEDNEEAKMLMNKLSE